MVTPDGQRQLQRENAEADVKFWSSLFDMHDVTVEDHKALAASVECTIPENKAAATRRFSKIAPIDRIIPQAPPVNL
jgi:hypothetical protein